MSDSRSFDAVIQQLNNQLDEAKGNDENKKCFECLVHCLRKLCWDSQENSRCCNNFGFFWVNPNLFAYDSNFRARFIKGERRAVNKRLQSWGYSYEKMSHERKRQLLARVSNNRILDCAGWTFRSVPEHLRLFIQSDSRRTPVMPILSSTQQANGSPFGDLSTSQQEANVSTFGDLYTSQQEANVSPFEDLYNPQQDANGNSFERDFDDALDLPVEFCDYFPSDNDKSYS